MSVECDREDVIRLILQYLSENKLYGAVKALSEESNVSLNTVDSVTTFVHDIQQGNWDSVIRAAQCIRLPKEKLIALYDQVVVELLEMKETDVARLLLKEAEACVLMKQSDPQRYIKLTNLCDKPFPDARELYPDGSSREKRRGLLANSLSAEVQQVPPSRLTRLLKYAILWQQQIGELPSGTQFDLFRGEAPVKADTADRPPKLSLTTIKFRGKALPNVVRFSPNGAFCVTGTHDGYIEVWDPETGKHRKDLQYQTDQKYMVMESSVMCIGFSKDSTLLIAGDIQGNLTVFKPETGQIAKKFTDIPRGSGISSCNFNRENSKAVTGGFDKSVRVLGMNSGKMLHEFKHESPVLDVNFIGDQQRVVSCSQDGSVKIWDLKQQGAVHTFKPPLPNPNLEKQINCVLPFPKSNNILVCPRTPQAFLIDSTGKAIKVLNSGKLEKGDFVTASVSPRGDYAYCVGEDNILYCFTMGDSKLNSTLKVKSRSSEHKNDEAVSMAHHPNRNLLAIAFRDGSVSFFVDERNAT